ncbi:MAG: hypothetical protein ABIT37_24880 [Luteolibacter sp.]
MKRRNFIQLGIAGLVGCGGNQRADEVSVKAGPFILRVPAKWQTLTEVEKVALRPLYSREGWKNYQTDEQYALKPAYACRPQHWAIRVPGALPEGIPFNSTNPGDDPTAPQILIHKAEEWGVAFTDGEHQQTTAADRLRSLRESMNAAMSEDDSGPSPAYMDASLAFMCLKRRIDFTGGHGLRLVSQWSIEPELMRRGELHYLFLGMSDDNSCQIIGTFPLNLPGLPTSEQKNHLGRSSQNYEDFSKNYEGYVQDAKKWLETYVDEITPSIQTLDEMMRSLVARRWE